MREREIKRSPLFLQCFRPAVLNKGSKRREREREREREGASKTVREQERILIAKGKKNKKNKK